MTHTPSTPLPLPLRYVNPTSLLPTGSTHIKPVAAFTPKEEARGQRLGRQTVAMKFSTRNAFYLRASNYRVIPLFLYLDERHVRWAKLPASCTEQSI